MQPTNGQAEDELTGVTTRGHRREITHGTTWGQSDPLQGEWTVPPESLHTNFVRPARPPRLTAHAKHVTPTTEQARSIVRRGAGVQATPQGRPQSGRRMVETGPRTGIYDPLRDTWLVEPQDKRVVEGLSYRPRGIFNEYGRSA